MAGMAWESLNLLAPGCSLAPMILWSKSVLQIVHLSETAAEVRKSKGDVSGSWSKP